MAVRFYSTNNHSLNVSLKEAVLNAFPKDKGLYMPHHIPTIDRDLHHLSLQEIAFEVSRIFLDGALPENDLRNIVEDAINFEAPLIQISEDKYALELFHGPTLAFKDFGARFMSRLMSYYAQQDGLELTILAATSGDTGSAVAHGFYEVPGINVMVFYPKGKVSELQEKQMTTLGKNITVFEVDGTFDDCQLLVKKAFLDPELNKKSNLTSANSINIARLIPQMFYYFYAYHQLDKGNNSIVFSVPSGNFGNLTAGLLAKRMGMKRAKFIASTNINDVVPHYLKSGHFIPKPSKSTISNAMDVGNPSNFSRMLDLYKGKTMRDDLVGMSFTDSETRNCIADIYQTTGYVLDPHGAVGYLGLDKESGIFLETAHPAKFLDIVEPVIQRKIKIPERLEKCQNLPKQTIPLKNIKDTISLYASFN